MTISGGGGAPLSVKKLERTVAMHAGEEAMAQRHLKLMAMVVVAQMMPAGAIKGGTAMKIRMGHRTRTSLDLDVARAMDLEVFVEELQEKLRAGWHGFTGVLVAERQAKPDGVPTRYVMSPFRVKLSYMGSSWRSVTLEVGHDELGDTLEAEMKMDSEIIELFARAGLPDPQPVALLAPKHQIAQKLHAASGTASERAHDLVDLQLLIGSESLDLAEVKGVCIRLFSYRRLQTWPPTIVENENWDSLYIEAADGIEVLPTVSEAVQWANDLIAEINAS